MRSRYLPITVLLASLMVTMSRPARAENLRCGSKIVQTGDPRDVVRNKCGQPNDVAHQSILRRSSYVRGGRVYFLGDELVEIPVEIWSYNFGPNKFMRRLRFVDGLLEEIETLGYGYNESN
jgi:hypothetical protein